MNITIRVDIVFSVASLIVTAWNLRGLVELERRLRRLERRPRDPR